MNTFRVKNFESFQHYKDRAPPWIKLYNELLDDYDFGLLPDASKMHLVAIWLLASRSDNKIPYDAAWVAKRINATEPVNLGMLVEKGFILLDQPLPISEQVASNTLAECLSRERVEGERETEKIAAPPRTRTVSEKARKANATPLPDNYALPEKVAFFGATQGLSDHEMNREHQRFCNHAKQNDRRCVDWIAAERNWMIGSAEKLGKSPRSEATPEEIPGFYAKFGSEEQDAWDAYGKAKSGKTFPRDKNGGWRHPTQWPPGYTPVSAGQQTDAPRMRTMQ